MIIREGAEAAATGATADFMETHTIDPAVIVHGYDTSCYAVIRNTHQTASLQEGR